MYSSAGDGTFPAQSMKKRMPRTVRARRGVTLLVLAGATAGTLTASSVQPAMASPETSTSIPSGDWPTMEEHVGRDGQIPVIVTLRTATKVKAPHELSPERHRTQAKNVAWSRGQLDREMQGKKLRNHKAMYDIPLIAFHASAGDLAKLKRSKVVAAVVEDLDHELPDSKGTGDVGPPVTTTPGPLATSSNGASNHLGNWWDYYRIGVDKALSTGYRGTGQTVAIIDTGVDRYHSGITNVVNEACFATAQLGSTAGYCPNGSFTQLGLGAARPCLQMPSCGHGTHVAHTAAGTNGVAPGAKIIAVQVFRPGANGPTYWDSDLVWGMKHVYDNRGYYRIAAVNLSLGNGTRYSGYCDTMYSTAGDMGKLPAWISSLKSVGTATVIASGNQGFRGGVAWPACISTAVTVGNTTAVGTADHVYVSSSSGPQIDVLAPGTDICSAVPGNTYQCDWIGTSMAAPHVAGAYAVLRQLRPTASVDQVLTALQRSGTAVADGYGVTRTRIHVHNALYWI